MEQSLPSTKEAFLQMQQFFKPDPERRYTAIRIFSRGGTHEEQLLDEESLANFLAFGVPARSRQPELREPQSELRLVCVPRTALKDGVCQSLNPRTPPIKISRGAFAGLFDACFDIREDSTRDNGGRSLSTDFMEMIAKSYAGLYQAMHSLDNSLVTHQYTLVWSSSGTPDINVTRAIFMPWLATSNDRSRMTSFLDLARSNVMTHSVKFHPSLVLLWTAALDMKLCLEERSDACSADLTRLQGSLLRPGAQHHPIEAPLNQFCAWGRAVGQIIYFDIPMLKSVPRALEGNGPNQPAALLRSQAAHLDNRFMMLRDELQRMSTDMTAYWRLDHEAWSGRSNGDQMLSHPFQDLGTHSAESRTGSPCSEVRSYLGDVSDADQDRPGGSR
ncbi:Uu.00g140780.m01.CDS01 [Anthostomella pinea]|uniref:Uu.00g140780.m01.CDS01 n=1 Tax=Anthostomella pinea TaxID=933095 RepID=A0AAI8VQ68_9PEZI|nr:Uu.00g140780.m01.CDS01 [Anthostomella pinea]